MAKVLEVLSDGRRHTLKEIQQKAKLDKNQIQLMTEFLERYSFISVDKTAREVILDKTVQKFLTKKSTS